ncbi:MAG: hypothetical protein BBJ60_12685 [Desulfobacterales bacterium S7086C20]|nr:MAG: hypothetical protein BBJ60_12685 [Desulfobacterales bacterium S7086C20]
MTKEPNVSDRLLELVQNMSEAEQKRAVKMLEAQQSPERRQSLRMKCLVPVDWATPEVSHKDFVRDINDNGTFIETTWPLNIGQELSMVFTLPVTDMPIKIKGQVVWTGTLGIGVNFKTGHGDLGLLMKYL